MQATHAWYGPIERVPKSKREFWFTLIRVIIVVALIGAAARFVAIAFAPQSSAMSQQLNCPPDVVTHRETVVSPQVLSVTEQSATSVASGHELANKSDRRSMNGKEEGHQSGAKKPPAYSFARNGVSPKRAAMGELAKRGGTDANQQQKAKASAATLAHSGIFPSPFSDMKGQ
jgi:cytoskeletal protein RodZ